MHVSPEEASRQFDSVITDEQLQTVVLIYLESKPEGATQAEIHTVAEWVNSTLVMNALLQLFLERRIKVTVTGKKRLLWQMV